MTAFMMLNGNYMPMVTEISAQSLADENGLQVGDIVREVNGQEVLAFFEIGEKFSQGGDPTEITVSRGEERITLRIPRVEIEDTMMLGITTAAYKEKLPLFRAAFVGTRWMAYMTKSIFSTLGGLITGRGAEGAIVGPVGTIGMIAQEVQTGWRNIVLLIAMISLNLGIFNLLPLPALDGGRLIFLLYAMIRKKPFPPEKEGMIHFVGLVLLFALMIFLTFQDIGVL